MNPATAVALLTELLRQALAISALIKAAHDENRDLKAEEFEAILTRDDVARAKLIVAIDAAKAAGG